MNEITILPPEYAADRIRLRWTVSPGTGLYRRTGCEWIFPSVVDVQRLPPSLVALAVLFCLHPHWVLLQPCRVRLPFALSDADKEFWRRLMRMQWDTMEAYRRSGESSAGPRIELEGEGPALERPATPFVRGARCASAFSGGKDSLFQAGVLSEISEWPLLVAVTSPQTGTHDHGHPKRRHVLDVIESRCRAQRLEVESDFRSCWDNRYPHRLGYAVAVNELTDTFFYLAMTMLAAASQQAAHLFLASENEVQENLERDGRLIQHPHAMYSAVALGAVGALLAPWGFTCSSLSTPLHSGQVQQILWRRYPRLRDLQFSCWLVKDEAAMCNRCPQCLRIALCAAAAGGDPAEMGADLAGVLVARRDWRPRAYLPLPEDALPKQKVSARLGAQVLAYARDVPFGRAWALIRRGGAASFLKSALAFLAFSRLKGLARRHPCPAWTGYAAAWMEGVDPLVRFPLRLIIESYFRPAAGTSDAEGYRRSRAAAAWIAEPLASVPRAADQGGAVPDGVERIEAGGALLGLVIRAGFRKDGICFFTPPAFSQQLGYMRRAAGYRIAPHVHLPVARALVDTQEALWIRSGRVRIDFYEANQAYAASRILAAGDVVLLVCGGHGFEMLEDSEMIEVKQGPMATDPDKRLIEPVDPGLLRMG